MDLPCESDCVRDEVVREHIEDYDADVGVGDMLNDYHEAHFDEGRREEEPEAIIKVITICCLCHNNPFTGIPRFLN